MLWAAAISLTACQPQSASSPQAWIDAPQHDSTHPRGPLEIVVHAADPGGVAMVEVSIDGEVFVRRAPDDTSSPLTTFRIDWDPQYGGEVVLSARAFSHAGAWGSATTNTVTLTGPAVTSSLPAVQQLPVATARSSLARPTPTPLPRRLPTDTPVAACTNAAKFMADVNFPDDTQVTPGQSFTKVWRLRNDGTCTWNEEYKLVFVGGEAMSNNTPLPVPGVVPPGGTLDVAVDLVAPTSAGTYRGDYQIRDPQGAHFGVGASGHTPFYVQIVVGHPAPPSRPTSPPAPDTQAPRVSVSHSPSGGSLPTGSTISFSANASDNLGVVTIELWVTAPGGWPTLVKTCSNSSSCSFTGGPYPTQGNLAYFAIARDAAGNQGSSNAGSVQLYVVITQLLRLAL
jgi:hypothetical protein